MTTRCLLTEIEIIKIGKVIRGFRTSRECANRLRAAGYSHQQIVGADVSTAIWREVQRQFNSGERPRIKTNHAPPVNGDVRFAWSAITADYDETKPIGRGATEFAAIMDLVKKLEAA